MSDKEATLILYETDVNEDCSAPTVIHLNKDKVLIGRSSNTQPTDYAISFKKFGKEIISRKHACIMKQRNGKDGRIQYVISDLGAINGLYINGQRISEHTLIQNDVIQFGGSGGVAMGALINRSDANIKYQFKDVKTHKINNSKCDLQKPLSDELKRKFHTTTGGTRSSSPSLSSSSGSSSRKSSKKDDKDNNILKVNDSSSNKSSNRHKSNNDTNNTAEMKMKVVPQEINENWRPVNTTMKRATEELKILSSSSFMTSTTMSSSTSSILSSYPTLPITQQNQTIVSNNVNVNNEISIKQLTEQVNTLQHIIQQQEIEQLNLQQSHATKCTFFEKEIILLKDNIKELDNKKQKQMESYTSLNNRYGSLHDQYNDSLKLIEKINKQLQQQQQQQLQLQQQLQQQLEEEKLLQQQLQQQQQQQQQMERKHQLSKIVSPTDHDSSLSLSYLSSTLKNNTMTNNNNNNDNNPYNGCLIDISTLRAALCCPICSATLVEGVVLLSCSHGFCRACIESEWHRHGNDLCRGACVVCHDIREYKKTKSIMIERAGGTTTSSSSSSSTVLKKSSPFLQNYYMRSDHLDNVMWLLIEGSSRNDQQIYAEREKANHTILRRLGINPDIIISIPTSITAEEEQGEGKGKASEVTIKMITEPTHVIDNDKNNTVIGMKVFTAPVTTTAATAGVVERIRSWGIANRDYAVDRDNLKISSSSLQYSYQKTHHHHNNDDDDDIEDDGEVDFHNNNNNNKATSQHKRQQQKKKSKNYDYDDFKGSDDDDDDDEDIEEEEEDED